MSCGYSMHPSQPLWLMTLHTTGVSKYGTYPRRHQLPSTVYEQQKLLGPLDTVSRQADIHVQRPAGQTGAWVHWLVPGLWASSGWTQLSSVCF